MVKPLEKYKPAASARVHLLLASAMWTVVGGCLLYFGVRWVAGGKTPYAWLLLAVACAAGLLKAHFVLRRAAERTVKRILTRGDGNCIGGFLSIKTWVLVLLMITAGRFLRGGLLARTVVGLIYAAVGLALLVASLRVWSAWYTNRAAPGSSAESS